MSLASDLRCRAPGPELMDAPDCDETMLLRTIDQFRIINPLFSRYRAVLNRWVLQDMLRDSGREYHLEIDRAADRAGRSVARRLDQQHDNRQHSLPALADSITLSLH